MESILPILQNIVGIPAYDHAGALFCQLQDHIALDVPQKIRSGKAVHHAGNALGGKGVGKETLTGGVFAVFFHKFGRETGLQSDLIHQLLIIKGNAQFLGDLMTDGTATAAKLTADGDDFLFHKDASSQWFSSYIILIDYLLVKSFCVGILSVCKKCFVAIFGGMWYTEHIL